MLVPKPIESAIIALPQMLSTKGADPTSGVDCGPILNTLFGSASPVIIDTASTAWLIDTTVNVPSSFSTSMAVRGVGKGGKIVTAASPHLTNNVLFAINANPDGTPFTSYTNNCSTVVEDLYINVSASFNNNVGILAFLSNGSVIFRNLLMENASTGVRLGNAYNDLVDISNISVLSQLLVDANSWIVDLYQSGGGYACSAGDGVRISGIQAAGAFSAGVATRCQTVRASNHHQLKIERILNGDILLIGCVNPKIERCHFENGHTTLQQCQDAVVEHSTFYMCNSGSINYGTPIVVSSQSITSDTATQNSVSLRELYFYYLPAISGDLMMDRTGVPNLSLTGSFSIEIEKLLCGFTPSNYQVFSERGITTGIPAFDNYSHIASLRSRLTNGGGSTPVVDLNLSYGFTAARNASATLAIATQSGVASVAPTATYFYKANLLYDAKRRIGYASNEVSLAVTSGGNVPRLCFGSSDLCQPVIIEIYRGTASGIYDHVVRYPYISGRSLYDLGDCVNGMPWTIQIAGAAETLNTGLLAGLNLTPGDTATSSDAYGHAEAWTDSNTLPTTGAWRSGDKVWLRVPSLVTGGMYLAGWVRITNCAEASPANALGTDWQAIYISSTGSTSAINGVPIPLSKAIVGTDANGCIADATASTLANNTSGTAANLSGTPLLPNGTTATTQSAGDKSTKLATTAYADQRLPLVTLFSSADIVTAATAFAGSGNISPFASAASIAANTIKATTLLRVTLAGSITTSATTPPVLTIVVKLGGITVWTGNTGLVPNVSEGGYPFGFSLLIRGTAAPSGSSNVMTSIFPGGGTAGIYQPHTSSSYNPVTSQVTNGSLSLQPYVYASANTAGNSITLNQFVVEVVQP